MPVLWTWVWTMNVTGNTAVCGWWWCNSFSLPITDWASRLRSAPQHILPAVDWSSQNWKPHLLTSSLQTLLQTKRKVNIYQPNNLIWQQLLKLINDQPTRRQRETLYKWYNDENHIHPSCLPAPDTRQVLQSLGTCRRPGPAGLSGQCCKLQRERDFIQIFTFHNFAIWCRYTINNFPKFSLYGVANLVKIKLWKRNILCPFQAQ